MVFFMFPSGSKLDTKMCRYCDYFDKKEGVCLLLKTKQRCKFGIPELVR